MRWFVFLLTALLICAPACLGEVKPESWQRDLRDLEKQLAERHVDLFHTVSRERFEAAVNDLHEQIPRLTPPEILVGIAQVVAIVGDGHTSFFAAEQRNWRFHIYPLKLWAFSDGIYVTATTPEHQDVYGRRLLRIDETPIEEAYRGISTTVAADNEMEYKYTVPFELTRAEMLHVLGIAASPDRAVFHFEGGLQKTFHALTVKEWLKLDWRTANSLYQGKTPFSTRLEALFATPLVLEHLEQRKYYWTTWLEKERTLFLQYNNCWDQKGQPTFAEVVAELLVELDERSAERLIIDLRNNTGGEPAIAEPLINELAKRTQFAKDGRLFVLVGRRTFSAALTNAAQLRSRAGARIVGEAPRGKPNNPSEGRDIDLKRTKIRATVSTQFVERDPALGDARYLPVEIETALSFDQFRKAEDPALDAALSAKLYRDAKD